jgi:hypothetical protein
LCLCDEHVVLYRKHGLTIDEWEAKQ